MAAFPRVSSAVTAFARRLGKRCGRPLYRRGIARIDALLEPARQDQAELRAEVEQLRFVVADLQADLAAALNSAEAQSRSARRVVRLEAQVNDIEARWADQPPRSHG